MSSDSDLIEEYNNRSLSGYAEAWDKILVIDASFLSDEKIAEAIKLAVDGLRELKEKGEYKGKIWIVDRTGNISEDVERKIKALAAMNAMFLSWWSEEAFKRVYEEDVKAEDGKGWSTDDHKWFYGMEVMEANYEKEKGGVSVTFEDYDAERVAEKRLQETESIMVYLAGDELLNLKTKYFGEELRMVEEAVQGFLKQKDITLENVREWDKEGTSGGSGEKVNVPEAFNSASEGLAELGMFGLTTPEKYGGSGLKHYYGYRMVQILSSLWPSLAVTIAVSSSAHDTINKFGTDEQKEDILPKLATGEIGAIAITEPDAGSDVMSMKISANKEGSSYVLNGTKTFITSAGITSVYLVFAVTDKGEGKDGKKKLSAFLVDKDTPGFSIGRIEKKMGQHSSPTGELKFEDCKIPEENMLGKPGEGRLILGYMLAGGRIGIASVALGIARTAYDAAFKYATEEREQFGKPIGDFRPVRERLDNMEFYIAASELLIGYASYLKDKDPDARDDMNAMNSVASMAKLYSGEKGHTVTLDALKTHGGYGYMVEYGLAQLVEDIIVTMIYEGTSDIQEVVIQKNIPLFLKASSVLSPEMNIEGLMDSYLYVHEETAVFKEEIEDHIGDIYQVIGEAKKRLGENSEGNRSTHYDAALLTDLVVARLMLFKCIFLHTQDNVSKEVRDKSLKHVKIAARFLRDSLNKEKIFSTPIGETLPGSNFSRTGV